MSEPNYFSRLETTLRSQSKSKGALAAHLGIALSTVSRWRKAVPLAETVQATADWLGVDAKWLLTGKVNESPVAENVESEAKVKEVTPIYGKKSMTTHTAIRAIPLVGWAHAGDAESYEEIPLSWRDRIPTDCPDSKAFAVVLEGDSMEPKFSDGDILIVQPTAEPHSGCFVVARFADDGVIFRRFEAIGKTIRLVPLNERYLATEHQPSDFSWIYPVWGRITQIWRR